VLDLTGGLTILAITGPEAGTVLRRLTHLHHFPAGGEVAHIQAHVLERDAGYWIVCPQELGEYVWEVAVDRASALGGGPVGVDALGGAR
jgi:glycine cleavage system aminomethyltransferase T